MSRVFVSSLATHFHSLVSIFPIPSRYISIFRAPPPRYFSPSLSKVVGISEGKIDVIEIVPDGEGNWLERPRSLTLKERS
ncbi:pilus assembly protein PilP [Pseudomonas aeruginosa]